MNRAVRSPRAGRGASGAAAPASPGASAPSGYGSSHASTRPPGALGVLEIERERAAGGARLGQAGARRDL